jgi:hypothetical protein
MRILARFDSRDRDDFDGRKSDLAVEEKDDRIGGGITGGAEHRPSRLNGTMADLNRRGDKSVFIKKETQASEQHDANGE